MKLGSPLRNSQLKEPGLGASSGSFDMSRSSINTGLNEYYLTPKKTLLGTKSTFTPSLNVSFSGDSVISPQRAIRALGQSGILQKGQAFPSNSSFLKRSSFVQSGESSNKKRLSSPGSKRLGSKGGSFERIESRLMELEKTRVRAKAQKKVLLIQKALSPTRRSPSSGLTRGMELSETRKTMGKNKELEEMRRSWEKVRLATYAHRGSIGVSPSKLTILNSPFYSAIKPVSPQRLNSIKKAIHFSNYKASPFSTSHLE